MNPPDLLQGQAYIDALELGGRLLRRCAEQSRALRGLLEDTGRCRQLQQLREQVGQLLLSQGDEIFDESSLASLLRVTAGAPEPLAARALVLGLEDVFGADTRGQGLWELFRARGDRDLAEGESVAILSHPIRALLGQKKLNSRRESHGLRLDETEHLRLVPSLRDLEVRFAFHARDFLAGLHTGFTAALLLPNAALADELTWDDASRDGQPRFCNVRPRDPARQEERLRRLVQAAAQADANLGLLPELSTTPTIVDALRGLSPRPPVLLAGSYHHPTREPAEPPGQAAWRNTAALLLPQGEVRHDKFEPFSFHGSLEDIRLTPARITVHATASWTCVALVCKDFLAPRVAGLLGELGVRLVLVASCSPKTDLFDTRARAVVADAQGIVLIANTADPAPEGEPQPAAALLGLPLADAPITIVPRDEVRPPQVVLFTVAPGSPVQVALLEAPPRTAK